MNLYNSGQAVCGAKGCTRACMISLEKRGVMKNTFKKPFRRKPLWQMDWSDYEPIPQENEGQSLSDLGSMSKQKKTSAAQNEVSAAHDKEAD
jgi:hypothetical protein